MFQRKIKLIVANQNSRTAKILKLSEISQNIPENVSAKNATSSRGASVLLNDVDLNSYCCSPTPSEKENGIQSWLNSLNIKRDVAVPLTLTDVERPLENLGSVFTDLQNVTVETDLESVNDVMVSQPISLQPNILSRCNETLHKSNDKEIIVGKSNSDCYSHIEHEDTVGHLNPCEEIPEYDAALDSDCEEFSAVELSQNSAYVCSLGEQMTPLPLKKKASFPRKERKTNRNLGFTYVSSKGKHVPKKEYEFIDCNCRYKCALALPSEEREKIFKSYWKLGSWDLQSSFILQSVICSQPERRTINARVNGGKMYRVNFSRQYFLGGKKICKNAYMNSLSISHMRIDYCLKKKSKPNMGVSSPDKRGKVTPNKTKPEILDAVEQFLDSFPKYFSH